MDDPNGSAPDEGTGSPAPDKASGIKFLFLIFVLPLLLIFLAQWLVF